MVILPLHQQTCKPQLKTTPVRIGGKEIFSKYPDGFLLSGIIPPRQPEDSCFFPIGPQFQRSIKGSVGLAKLTCTMRNKAVGEMYFRPVRQTIRQTLHHTQPPASVRHATKCFTDIAYHQIHVGTGLLQQDHQIPIDIIGSISRNVGTQQHCLGADSVRFQFEHLLSHFHRYSRAARFQSKAIGAKDGFFIATDLGGLGHRFRGRFQISTAPSHVPEQVLINKRLYLRFGLFDCCHCSRNRRFICVLSRCLCVLSL